MCAFIVIKMLNIRTKLLSLIQQRLFSGQAKVVQFDDEANHTWKDARDYESIPGPSSLNLLRSFLPGGKFHSIPFTEFHQVMGEKYGKIYKLVGIFGKRDMVIVTDPKDFEVVFRTEGSFPVRRVLDVVSYYRKNCRKEWFPTTFGLFVEHEERWWDLRQKVNGIMMKPQIIKGYTSSVDQVSRDFIQKLHNMRDENLETPPDLFYQLNIWALESIASITLNTRLGLLKGKPNDDVENLMENFKDFFQLSFKLEFQPSLWKIFKTPEFSRFEKIMDELQRILTKYVEMAVKNLQEMNAGEQGNSREKGVLEKLYEIDKEIAIVMAVDSLLAGVDSTSVAVFAVLYHLAINPEKQNILREEVLKILPEKDSPLTVENMKNVPYLRGCIKEAIRLMPVVSGNIRAIGQDIVVQGYRIPKNTDVFMPNKSIHMNDHFFPEAESFLPERWLRSQEKHENYNPFTYLPFGFGSRACVGRRFAQLEMESLVLRFVRNYHLEWHYPPPKIQSVAIDIPTGDLKLRLIDYQ